MKYISFTFLMLLLCQSAFSQSKKEQIEILIFQKDSLGRILEKERQLNTDQVKQLETKISKINSDMGLIQKELAQSKKDLAAKEEEIERSMVGQVLREDTIRSLREELHQIKASNFETFLPYFLSQAAEGAGFEYFVDKENIGYEIFENPGIFCTIVFFPYYDWTINEIDDLQISSLPFFRNQKSDGFCGDASSRDGIYYYPVSELPASQNPTTFQFVPAPVRLRNLNKMRVEIQFNNVIVKTYYFIEFKGNWYLLYVYHCDCSA